jgi:hypothetical protein
MSIKQSAASRTEVGPLQTATVGPDQTAILTRFVSRFKVALTGKVGVSSDLVDHSKSDV